MIYNIFNTFCWSIFPSHTLPKILHFAALLHYNKLRAKIYLFKYVNIFLEYSFNIINLKYVLFRIQGASAGRR